MPNFYWDTRTMEQDGILQPTILALGDSWFWYPMPGGSLLNYLGAILKPFGLTIYARGMNGAEAFDLVDGTYAKQVQVALQLYGLTPGGSGVQAVFVSAGGNDFAGFSDLRPLLQNDCSAFNEAADCFYGLREFFDEVELHYRKLIGLLYTSTQPDCRIVMHSYDYALPTGKGIFGSGSWLKQALDDAKVDPALQAACIGHLLTTFHDRLTNIAQADPEKLFVVTPAARSGRSTGRMSCTPLEMVSARLQRSAGVPVLLQAGLMNAA